MICHQPKQRIVRWNYPTKLLSLIHLKAVFVRNWVQFTGIMDNAGVWLCRRLQQFHWYTKFFFLMKCLIVLCSEADLEYDKTAAADCPISSFFSDFTVTANCLKISTQFSNKKDAKRNWLAVRSYSYEANSGGIAASEMTRTRALMRGSTECIIFGKAVFLASAGLLSWKKEDVSGREPIKFLVIWLYTNRAFLKCKLLNPFQNTNFNMEQFCK